MKNFCVIFFVMIYALVGQCAPPDSTSMFTQKVGEDDKIMQRFNPIYGNNPESNEIISFISSNLVVGLRPDQMKRLDGYLVIQFEVDTLGDMGNLQIRKSYNSWVDWVILGALVELPPWGIVPRNRDGSATTKTHQIVFTFGSYVRGGGTYGFQDETVARNTQNEIDKQNAQFAADVKKRKEQWGTFTDVNAKLEYDTKQGLKQEATILDGINPLDGNNAPKTVIPTISITEL